MAKGTSMKIEGALKGVTFTAAMAPVYAAAAAFAAVVVAVVAWAVPAVPLWVAAVPFLVAAGFGVYGLTVRNRDAAAALRRLAVARPRYVKFGTDMAVAVSGGTDGKHSVAVIHINDVGRDVTVSKVGEGRLIVDGKPGPQWQALRSVKAARQLRRDTDVDVYAVEAFPHWDGDPIEVPFRGGAVYLTPLRFLGDVVAGLPRNVDSGRVEQVVTHVERDGVPTGYGQAARKTRRGKPGKAAKGKASKRGSASQ